MSVYLQELEDIKAIKAIYIPPKGSDKPCVYQINQNMSKIGRGFKPQRLSSQKDAYTRTKMDVAVSQDSVLTCGTLDSIQDKKKGDATNTAKRTRTKQKARSSKQSITQEPDFTQDPEIPFNDISGQMDISDFPECMPEGAKQ